jgi:hypothetical protein
MLNTTHSRFSGGSARWLKMPAVLISAGVALASLALGAGAVGAATPASSRTGAACGPVVHALPCGKAAQPRTVKLQPVTPVGALPRIAKPMPGTPPTADSRARIAKLRAQMNASMPGLHPATAR